MRGWRGQWADGRWWWRHWQAALFDVLPAFVLLALGEVDALSGSLSVPFGSAPPSSAAIPTAIACAALVLRRRYPTLCLAIVLFALVIPPIVTPTSLVVWGEFVPWLLALYSCSRHQNRARALLGLIGSAVAMVALVVMYPDMGALADLLYNSVVLAAAWMLGLFSRSWAAYRDRIIRAESERAAAEERAGRAERVRIARELHDVIAHTVTVIVMQAGGARMASVADPEVASRTLAQVEELGRASLAELRTLLAVLREDNEDLPMAPQPTLDDVDALCDRMRALGLPLTLTMDDGARRATLGLQLIAYRVVQEGLTNVLKHAGLAATSIRIVCVAACTGLTIDVSNGAGGGSGSLPASGRGLLGVAERVRLAGGAFAAGPDVDGGFLLHVELPGQREVA